MDLRTILKRLKAQGWTEDRTRSDHLRVRSPKGDLVIYSSTTGDNMRSIHNFVAALRKKGAEL